ncbi:PREDICTED: C-C motif chemokine 4 homolog [Aptenodytes forsteri]|uniref:C-C motif chemokine 4 homolog n=1 Tax=Aptenodytes forsteri TaxID=9233 RepID=UPI0009055D31|nr:PREDICTED: C-C motif chemokine 4 homolog [Aptenodytes forsteri]
MKVLAAALAALLLVAICSPAEAHVDVPMACCFSYLYHCIPHSFIASTYKTSSKCPQPGVIFVTRNGRKICTDPQEPWVQEQLKCFQMLEY